MNSTQRQVIGILSSREEVTISKEVMSACLGSGLSVKDAEVKFVQLRWTIKIRL